MGLSPSIRGWIFNLVIWLPLVGFNGYLAWDRYEAKVDTQGFNFQSLSVAKQDGGKLFLVLHRTVKADIIADFSVSLYDHAPSCNYKNPGDTIEAERKKPFLSRFLARFNDRCIQELVLGPAIVTVTYHVGSDVFSLSTTFELTQEEIDYELKQRHRGTGKTKSN